MQSRTAAVVGGGVAVFVAVFAIAILTFSRCCPQLGAVPTARSSPVGASPSTGGQNSPQPSLSPFPEESPSPSPSPEPTPSPQPGQPLVFTDLALHPAD